MNRFRVVLLVPLLMLIILPAVSAQTVLYPNQMLTEEFLWGRNDFGYSHAFYEVNLTSGHWTVKITVPQPYDLEVNITVATDHNMTDIIAVSGTGRGNYPEVDFSIDSDMMLYILVHENSVYGNTAGFYYFGVYDDEHLGQATTSVSSDTTTLSPPITEPFELFGTFFLFFVIAIAMIFVFGIAVCLRMRSPGTPLELQVVQAPQSAIPEGYQPRAESDDGLRMVRIPVECPKCKAPLSQEGIDWVGPLEARCQYCGATVRATFEKI